MLIRRIAIMARGEKLHASQSKLLPPPSPHPTKFVIGAYANGIWRRQNHAKCINIIYVGLFKYICNTYVCYIYMYIFICVYGWPSAADGQL